MTMTDDPAWVVLVQRLRAIAEQYGPETEAGWLAAIAADQIVSDNQTIARLTEHHDPSVSS